MYFILYTLRALATSRSNACSPLPPSGAQPIPMPELEETFVPSAYFILCTLYFVLYAQPIPMPELEETSSPSRKRADLFVQLVPHAVYKVYSITVEGPCA